MKKIKDQNGNIRYVKENNDIMRDKLIKKINELERRIISLEQKLGDITNG